MKHKSYAGRALALWLMLMCGVSVSSLFAQVRVSTLDELMLALQQPDTKAGEVVIQLTEPVAVTKEIPVNKGGAFQVYGEPIYRAEAYTGTMIKVYSGNNLTIENKVDGKGILSASPILEIESGAEATLVKGGMITGALRDVTGQTKAIIKVSQMPSAVDNHGTFTLEDGGLVSGNAVYTATTKAGVELGDLEVWPPQTGYVSYEYSAIQSDGSLILEGGTVKDNDSYLAILNLGSMLLHGEAEISGLVYANKEITLCSSLKYPLSLGVANPSEGRTLMSGTNYRIDEEDLAQMELASEEYALELSGNNVVIAKKEATVNKVITEEDLREAIAAAPTGSADRPTEIIIEGTIELSKGIVIDKYISLTGGGTIYCFGGGFEIESGQLTTENITLDGGNSATAHNEVSLVILRGGEFVMNDGTTLCGAGLTSDISAVWIFGGTFIMNGGFIKDNYFFGDVSMASVISVYEGGSFIMNGGYIQESYGENVRTISLLGYNGNVTFEFHGGFINSGGFVYFAGGKMFITSGNPNMMIVDNIEIREKSEFYLSIPLTYDYTFTIDEGTTLPDRFVLMRGNNYEIKASDLEYLHVPEGYGLELENNTVVLVSGSSATTIATQAELQEAIDNSAGTSDRPEFIDLGDAEILIQSPITIRNKYVVLVNGTLVNAASGDLCMIQVNSGLLRIAGTVLDGNKANRGNYCTLIRMHGGKCEIVEDTKLTNARARGGSDAVVSVSSGELAFNSGSITGNDSEGGDVVWVSGDGKFSMNGGTLSGNRNTGSYIMACIEITGGEMLISNGILGSNTGNLFGMYVTKPFTLEGDAQIKEVIMLTKEGRIVVASPLKHDVMIGFMKASMPSGTVVAEGTNAYPLTEADVEHFKYWYDNRYSFSLVNNQVVVTNLDAVNRTFKIEAESSPYGTITFDKTTAKENERVSVTVEPKDGYQVQKNSVRYNEINLLSSASVPNLYVFEMPPSDVTLSARFLPVNIEIDTVDTSGFDPDTDPTPDNVILVDDLPGLIDALGGGNHELEPEASPSSPEDWSDALAAAVENGEDEGDITVGSLDELLSHVSKGDDGQVLKTEVLKVIPGGCILRIYLPNRLIVSQQLRATGGASYYILRDCDGEVVSLVPEYDYESNSLTVKTDKLGTFVVMQGEAPLANEQFQAETVRVVTQNGQIVVHGLKMGERFSVYDLFGRLLYQGISDGSASYTPEISGVYILSTEHAGNYKVMIQK